jgi:hypothetical protein
MTWRAPRTWTAGEMVTDIILNQHLRDQLSSLKTEHFATQAFRGLTLSTHPSLYLSGSQVLLDHADEIVMDDGTRVGPWGHLTANIAVIGAGGLDTGAEAASTWYEVYAIRKSTDGTRALLLHAAPNPNAIEESGGTNANYGHLFRDVTARQRLAQGFQVDITKTYSRVHMHCARVGTISGAVWLTIEADASGAPSGTPLATSDVRAMNGAPTTFVLVSFNFRGGVALTAGTTYHIVIHSDVVVNASNHLGILADSANTYARGALQQWNGTAWSAASAGDLIFSLHHEIGTATPTMPSGYDQRALVGYVFNDASSNFSPFLACNRHVFSVAGSFQDSGAVTFTALFHCTNALPPTKGAVLVDVAGYSSVANDVVVIAGAPHGYTAAVQITQGRQIHLPAVNTEYQAGLIVTTQQILYVARVLGTGNVQARVKGYIW